MEIIEVEELSKNIVDGNISLEILKEINLTIKENEYIAIMGKSGSGKSTLLGILSGLDNATKGSFRVKGIELSKLTENKLAEFRNENYGIVFQNFNLIQSMTALENIQVPLYFTRNIVNIRKRSKELLCMLGLKGKEKLYPNQLSGGEQQRVAIARALATKPKILFADEPTGALDSKNTEIILNILKDFKAKYKMTIIMVTHDENVAKHADRIIYLEDGSLIEKIKGI